MNQKEMTSLIMRYAGKMLRTHFGKGPEVLSVSLDHRSLVLHMKKFTTPIEDVLLAKKDEKTFRYTRELMMKALVPELETFVREELHLNPMSLYYDWNLRNSSGVIVVLLDMKAEAYEDYENKEGVHEQIVEVLTKTQAKPSTIESWWVDSKTLLIFRTGIAILLEKELNDLGYTDILKTVKRKLEKEMLWEQAGIGRALRRPMTDLYIDWNFDRDDSVIVCRF
ncbi:Na-translocating system protein MpsC family protein [Saccharibacillus qingshengii]|uniref:Na-translocating system protein MpsC family protein n=1 Tax=Saccharibacillus qingshengii TaxID=1763540 RepID=UPI001554DCC3|nr:Na-translocating system protein MpsC family protein [Saccharibacillus qingshengii]